MTHAHTWTGTDGRSVCKVCGEHRPKLALRLRCEWCKELFDWNPRSVYALIPSKIRRTCGLRCGGALHSYEVNKRLTHAVGTGADPARA